MKNLLIALALLISFNSQATLINITFDKANYKVNEQITAQIVASDLSYILGGFDTELSFNPAMLSLTSWSFGNGFDDGIWGSLQIDDDSLPGSLLLAEYADLFADESVLAPLQGNSFVLATITFNALAAGDQVLSLLNGLNVVSVDNAFDDAFTGISGSFSVSEVPEPTSILLFLSSIFLLSTRIAKKN